MRVILGGFSACLLAIGFVWSGSTILAFAGTILSILGLLTMGIGMFVLEGGSDD